MENRWSYRVLENGSVRLQANGRTSAERFATFVGGTLQQFLFGDWQDMEVRPPPMQHRVGRGGAGISRTIR